MSNGVPGSNLGAGAVVALDIDDERVVELAQVVHRLDHPADLVISVGHVGGIYLRLTGEQLLVVGRERFPLGQVIRPGRQLLYSPG